MRAYPEAGILGIVLARAQAVGVPVRFGGVGMLLGWKRSTAAVERASRRATAVRGWRRERARGTPAAPPMAGAEVRLRSSVRLWACAWLMMRFSTPIREIWEEELSAKTIEAFRAMHASDNQNLVPL